MKHPFESAAASWEDAVAVLVGEHRVEVLHKRAVLDDLRVEEQRIGADMFRNGADAERYAAMDPRRPHAERFPGIVVLGAALESAIAGILGQRSEERRVGKECR